MLLLHGAIPGADLGTRRRANHARIDALIEEIETLDLDLRAAAAYGRLRAQLEHLFRLSK
jgi:predicted nucleic acid-binding protein